MSIIVWSEEAFKPYLASYNDVILVFECPTRIMSFGVRRNLHYPKLTDAVLQRILDNPSAITLRDTVKLMNFFSRVKIVTNEDDRKKLYETVLERIGEVTKTRFPCYTLTYGFESMISCRDICFFLRVAQERSE